MNLDDAPNFTFGGTYKDYSSLDTGAILNGSAGQIDINGNDNIFNQGNSKSNSFASAGDDAAARAMKNQGNKLLVLMM